MDSWKEIDERNKFKKKKINDVKFGRLRKWLQEEYWEKEKLVRRFLRKDKGEWVNNIVKEVESGVNLGNMKGIWIYDIIMKKVM